jgi:hypothetical protein
MEPWLTLLGVSLNLWTFQAAGPLSARLDDRTCPTKPDVLYTMALWKLIAKILIRTVVLHVEMLAAVLITLLSLVLLAATIDDEASDTSKEEEQTVAIRLARSCTQQEEDKTHTKPMMMGTTVFWKLLTGISGSPTSEDVALAFEVVLSRLIKTEVAVL